MDYANTEEKDRQLIQITDWNNREVRVEIFGNGNYIPKTSVRQWIIDNADRIANEVVSNIGGK